MNKNTLRLFGVEIHGVDYETALVEARAAADRLRSGMHMQDFIIVARYLAKVRDKAVEDAGGKTRGFHYSQAFKAHLREEPKIAKIAEGRNATAALWILDHLNDVTRWLEDNDRDFSEFTIASLREMVAKEMREDAGVVRPRKPVAQPQPEPQPAPAPAIAPEMVAKVEAANILIADNDRLAEENKMLAKNISRLSSELWKLRESFDKEVAKRVESYIKEGLDKDARNALQIVRGIRVPKRPLTEAELKLLKLAVHPDGGASGDTRHRAMVLLNEKADVLGPVPKVEGPKREAKLDPPPMPKTGADLMRHMAERDAAQKAENARKASVRRARKELAE